MGLFQKAVETFDCLSENVGVYRAGEEVLAPIGHVVTRADLEITLDENGTFCSAAAVDKSEPKILIPVTEDSASRSGTAAFPHPLCDQIGYLSSADPRKLDLYLKNLEKWEQSDNTHPMLRPILTYVKSGTILHDLAGCGLIQSEKELTKDELKFMIRWRVLGIGEEACWRDRALFQAFSRYYGAQLKEEGTEGLCMVSGNMQAITEKHPKGIVSSNGNAKLISSNDSSNFTYRGRFKESWQAASVGYEASQKAHNVLHWLLSNQSVSFKNRIFLCWNPQGRKVPTATGPFMQIGQICRKPTEYKKALDDTLKGYQSSLPEREGVVIAGFEAATAGRLSLTYYNELMGSDFLHRLYEWDLHCCWPTANQGLQSPNLFRIIHNAFGTQQTAKGMARMVADDKIVDQQIQRLISCRVDGAWMPWDIVSGLLKNASAPLSHDKKVREFILTTACAVVRKYRYDHMKEEWAMSLEPEAKDLSYQFGRLLAVFEKAERDTYGGDTDREPNAIRQQSVFCQHPMYAAANIQKQLEQAYFPRLKPAGRAFYKNLIGQIMAQISHFPENQWNAPLKETYLMGYYLQRNELYTKHTNTTEDEENE